MGDEGPLLMGMLMFPFGNWYAWNVLFSSFYVPHLVISMVSLGLLVHSLTLSEKEGRAKVCGVVLAVLLAALSFVSVLGGVRQLMICYAPLLAVTFYMDEL